MVKSLTQTLHGGNWGVAAGGAQRHTGETQGFYKSHAAVSNSRPKTPASKHRRRLRRLHLCRAQRNQHVYTARGKKGKRGSYTGWKIGPCVLAINTHTDLGPWARYGALGFIIRPAKHWFKGMVKTYDESTVIFFVDATLNCNRHHTRQMIFDSLDFFLYILFK